MTYVAEGHGPGAHRRDRLAEIKSPALRPIRC